MNLNFSVVHLIDSLGSARGLAREDMVECIKIAIAENFRLRGRIVSVQIENLANNDSEAVLSVQEMILTGGSPVYREVRMIPPIPPELLQQIIEEYAAKRYASHVWTLAECRVASLGSDHYILEIENAVAIQSADDTSGERQMAVLPLRNVNEGEMLSKGDTIWVAIKKYEHAKLDVGYADAWKDIDTNWIATRNDSQFLALMCFQMMGEMVQSIIHTSRGILIFPEGTDLQPLLADGAKHKNTLQKLCGLQRLCVARKSPRPEIHRKLIHAVEEVTGLKYKRDFMIGAQDPTKVPMIYVTAAAAPKLTGKNGHSLFFIKCVAGIQFEFKATSRIGQPRA